MKNFNLIEMAKAMKEHKLRHMWRYVAMMALLLTLACGQMWGEDFTITPIFTGSYLSPGNLVKVTMGSNTSESSSTIQVASNKNGSFTISTSAPGMYLKSATFTDTQHGGNKAITNLACTNGSITNSSGTCTYTASASTTSTVISFTGNTGGTAKIGSLSVVVTNGSLNNMETLSSFSISSGTYSFTSKINNSSVTSAVSLTTQASSSWGVSSSKLSIPSSNASKTLTISSTNNIRYVAIQDDDCRLTLVETSSTGGSCDGASWTAPSGVVNSVTFKNGISNSLTAPKVFVITEAPAAKDYTVTAATSTGDNTYGTVSAGASSLDATETTTITATPATGYQVTNWAVSDGDNGASISPNGASNSNTTTLTMGTANATVTATFGPKSYTVTLNNQSATTAGTENVPTTYNSNTNLTSAITKPTKTGYVFAGYFTATNGGGVQLIDAAGNWIASAGGGSTYTDGSKNWKYDNSLTLYACWMEYANSLDLQNYVETEVGSSAGDKTTSKEFTHLTSNNYICSLSGSTELDNSDDAAYRGLKFKNSGDYILFLVPANYSLSVKWGYVKSSKPKYSINGGAAQTFSTLSTGGDNSSSPGDIEISSQSYDQLVKIWSTDDGATVLKKVTITASCTAPNHVDISGNWDYFGGETISLTATPYSSAGTGSPITSGITGYQWQKLISSTWTDVEDGTDEGTTISGATTANLQIAGCTGEHSGKYRCTISTGATCSTSSATATDGTEGFQVKVFTLECYTGGTTVYHFTRIGETQTGSTTITLAASTGYQFKFHIDGTYYGNSGTINEDVSNWVCTSGAGNLTINSGLGGTFTITMDYSDGGSSSTVGEPEISVTYPRKTIYLNAGGSDLWDKDNAKFGIYYFRKESETLYGHAWTDIMPAYACGSGIYVTEIPQWNGVKINAVRLNPSATNDNKSDWWTSYKYNQTNNCPVTSNDYITITGWDEPDYTYTTYDAPEYTISFDGNGETSGSMTDVEDIACDASVTLEANAFVKTGYSFAGWKDASSNDYADEATINNIRANIALTAQWTEDKHSVTVAAGSNGTVSPSSVSNIGIATASGDITATANTGYHFTSWTLPSGTSAASTYSETSNPIHINATADDKTITANFSANTPTITLDDQDATNTPTGSVVATYGSSMPEIATLPTKTGYTFGGFYSAAAGGGTQYYTSTGASAQNSDLAEATTLYALWTQSISLDSEGGSSGSSSVTATYKSATLPSITNPEKDGYTFEGWYSGDDGTGDLVISKAGVLQASVSGYTGAGGIWTSTSSRTLYAKWEEEACTSQTISKVVVTGSSAGTTSGYNEKEYVGTPVINVSGKTSDATNIDGVTGNETGYKMSSDGSSIVFATLAKGTFQAGDQVKIGITRRNDTRQVDSKYNILTIYYGTNKDDATALTTITTSGDNDNSAAEHEGAGFYTYTLTSSDVTTIGSKKGIGLFREKSNGENPYVYSVEIIGCRDWTTCTAPTAVAAGSETSSGATLTVTDGEDTNNYEFYINTSSTAPTADSSATATSSSKTKVITGLTASSTYYYWVRSNCGGYKSAWVAGTPATFTTSAAATTYSVTYNGNGNTGGSVPTDASTYEEGDLVTVKTNSGSLVKTSSDFVGWSTNATPSSGVFYPVGYKFAMPASNQTLYAVWGSAGATCVTLTTFETSTHDYNSSTKKPDSQGKYLYGYKGTVDADHALTITTTTTNVKGVDSGNALQLAQNTNFTIYADNTTTGGTPSTFTDVTSVSFKIKAVKNTKIPTIEVYVGATKIKTVKGGDESSGSDGHEYDTSGFTTFTASGLADLDGTVKFLNTSSGSSDYKALFDDIQICYGSGAASGYDVTFNMQSHGSAISKIEDVPNGAKIGEPLPEPTAIGYAFGGWYREAGCTNAWNFGSNTISRDTTLYAKWTTCAPTISVHPSGTSYTQSASATALSVTAATNGGGDLEYQWYSNEENSNEDGTEIPSATSYTYTPSTALIGTVYYYCVVTNECGTVTSNVAAITINDAKSNPKATWTVAAPTHGGKGFSFSVAAKQNDGSTKWDGTLTAAMLSASADVVLSDVTVNNTDKTISGTYGVKASATSPVTFYLELPSTTNCAAATLEEEQEFTACSGTGADGSTYNVPFTSSYSSSATGKPAYRCETTYGYISPELGASSVSLASQSYAGFTYYINSGRSSVLIATKVDDVKKIQIYLNANSAAAEVTNVYTASSYSTALKDYTELSAKTDFTVSYTDEDDNSSIAKGKNGYVELAFTTTLDEGTLVYVVLKKAAKYYGAKLTTGAGSGATITTALAWSNSQDDEATVEKGEDDAEFTITATRSGDNANASLGEIRYSSSDTKVATVNATTGQVAIADAIDFGSDAYKTTTIKATLISSGCYKSAAITYTLQVNKSVCADAAGTIEITEDNGCSGKVLTVSGYEEGATIQWQKDGVDIPSATGTTYTATASGTYTAVTTKACARTSNIIIEMAAATASKIVDTWYVKNGRRTPDIALVQTTGATGFSVTSGGGSLSNIGGCTFELKDDGIIYLHGTKDNGDEPSDMTAGDMTITITVTGCAGALDGLNITIKKQAETLKPSVAFVVDGTTRAKGGTATSVSTAKTSERALWTYLSSTFSLTGCNIYWSVDSKELREYYSQYDAIVVTDDPNTQTKGAGDVEYVKAFGTLVDVRPMLTMEAYVGRYSDGGWHVYNATPTSPNPRQVEMKLECRNHEIFAGVSPASDNVRTETINGDDYWYITIVDTTQSPYHNTSKDYKDLPALQGFSADAYSDMLGIGKIDEDRLEAGVERQMEPAARMMILGIQNNAMGALTNEGKLIIKNAISYLLKTNMEEVDDCSNYFIGGTEGHTNDWTVATNWSKNSVPDFTTKVRLMAPVVITNGQKIRVAQVDIVKGGASKHIDGEPNGGLTINPGGALIVGGTVNRAKAPHYGIDDLQPTTDEDIFIKADEDNSAALILDNSSGLTKATVEMYSPSFWEVQDGTNKKKSYWSYVGVPIQDVPVGEYFYGAVTYLYDETSGWIRKRIGSEFHAFEGIGLSLPEGHKETFYGTLASTETKEITLTNTTGVGEGDNLIGNSWTAPIQIGNFDSDDFGSATAVVSMYKTGRDDKEGNPTVVTATAENDGALSAGQWVSIPIGLPGTDGYDGPTVIPSMQAFQVTTSSETTLTLDYDKLVRDVTIATDNLTQPMSAPKRKMKRAAKKSLDAMMRVRMSGFKTRTDLWIMEDGRFSDEYDNGWEANYIECDNRSPQLYANSEIGKMAFLAKPDIEGTILGIAPSRDGNEYLFTFHYVGDEEFYLNDLKLKQSVLISEEESYSFMYEDGDTNRFYISRTRIDAPQMPTGVENTHEGAVKARKFIYNDKLYIMINGRIYSAEGALVK